MDIGLFLKMLEIDSTSSKERGFAEFLEKALPAGKCEISVYDVGDGTVNLLLCWGKPDIVYCTHIDTVPPYIPPAIEETCEGKVIRGRGSCDAKGQIFSMYNACLELEKQGCDGFGLLLLAGEETGSFGAKSFRKTHPGGEYVIVGEPTENRMISASKGTKSFGVTITGKSFHSGYPQYGESAVDKFVDFINALRKEEFPYDPVLGETTWNVGRLESPNPQNILSGSLGFRLYFRTTFSSDASVCAFMESVKKEDFLVEAFGGDAPSEYLTFDGFDTGTAAFGSDAPQLANFRNRILYGPGSILTAHTPDEFILEADMEKAVRDYVRMFHIIKGKTKEKVSI